MKELENLKEMFLDEIKKINKKSELSPADGEAAKKALEAICMIDEICDDTDEKEYSERSYRDRLSYNNYSQNGNMSRHYPMPEMDYGYNDGRYVSNRSYRRGRSNTTGRYISRHDGADFMIRKLEDLLHGTPDPETREAIECAIEKLEEY